MLSEPLTVDLPAFGIELLVSRLVNDEDLEPGSVLILPLQHGELHHGRLLVHQRSSIEHWVCVDLVGVEVRRVTLSGLLAVGPCLVVRSSDASARYPYRMSIQEALSAARARRFLLSPTFKG